MRLQAGELNSLRVSPTWGRIPCDFPELDRRRHAIARCACGAGNRRPRCDRSSCGRLWHGLQIGNVTNPHSMHEDLCLYSIANFRRVPHRICRTLTSRRSEPTVAASRPPKRYGREAFAYIRIAERGYPSNHGSFVNKRPIWFEHKRYEPECAAKRQDVGAQICTPTSMTQITD